MKNKKKSFRVNVLVIEDLKDLGAPIKGLARNVEVVIDYPMTNSYSKVFKSSEINTVAKLLKKASKMYKHVYDVDDRECAGTYEGDRTFGVWGHSLSDLAFEGVRVSKNGKKITFDVGS